MESSPYTVLVYTNRDKMSTFLTTIVIVTGRVKEVEV